MKKYILFLFFSGLSLLTFAQNNVTTTDANGILKQSTPLNVLDARYATGTTPPSDTRLIWKNPNISVNVGETTDFSYQQGTWQPLKALTLYDFGAKPYPYNSNLAIQKALNAGGVVTVPDTIFMSATPLQVYSNTTIKGGGRDKSWVEASFIVGDSTKQNEKISFHHVGIGNPLHYDWGTINSGVYAIGVYNVFNFTMDNCYVMGCLGGGLHYKDKGFISTNYKVSNTDIYFNKGEVFINAPNVSAVNPNNYFSDMVFVNCKINTGGYVGNYAIKVDVGVSTSVSFSNTYIDFAQRWGIALYKPNNVIKGYNFVLDNGGAYDGITLKYTPSTLNNLFGTIVNGDISLPTGIFIEPLNISVPNSNLSFYAKKPFLDVAVSNGINFTNTDDNTVGGGNISGKIIKGNNQGLDYVAGTGKQHNFDNMLQVDGDYFTLRLRNKNNTTGKTEIAVRTDGNVDFLTYGAKILNLDGRLKIDAKQFGGRPISISGLEQGNTTSDSIVTIDPSTGNLRRLAFSELPTTASNEINTKVIVTTSGGSIGSIGLIVKKTINFYIHWTAPNPTGGTLTLPSSGNGIGDAINIYFRGDGTTYTNLNFAGGTRDGVTPTVFNKNDWLRYSWDGSVWLRNIN
jgi:hypothetical protein